MIERRSGARPSLTARSLVVAVAVVALGPAALADEPPPSSPALAPLPQRSQDVPLARAEPPSTAGREAVVEPPTSPSATEPPTTSGAPALEPPTTAPAAANDQAMPLGHGGIQQPATAPGAPRSRAVSLVLSTGFDWGFEDLLVARAQDGGEYRIGVNHGLFVTAGAAFFPWADGRLHTRAAIGWKFAVIDASNGRADYDVLFVEVLESWSVAPVRISAGASLLFRQTLRGEGVLAGVDLDMRRSFGPVGQVDYVFGSPGGVTASAGVRWSWHSVRSEAGGRAVGASALGFVVGLTL